MLVHRPGFLSPAVFLAVLLAGGMALPAAAAEHLEGIDVSHWQEAVDWAKVKAAGKVFALCKATEGTKFIDPRFARNWAALKKLGLVRGAYHFGRPGSAAVAQARHFYQTVKPGKGDLPLVLDLEVTDGKTPAQVGAWTKTFLAEVRRLSGRPAIIYTSPSFWKDKAGDPADNRGCPLWVAAWAPAPTVPRAWKTWTFWQYSDKGSVPGVRGKCDLDRFNGSRKRLQALTLP